MATNTAMNGSKTLIDLWSALISKLWRQCDLDAATKEIYKM